MHPPLQESLFSVSLQRLIGGSFHSLWTFVLTWWSWVSGHQKGKSRQPQLSNTGPGNYLLHVPPRPATVSLPLSSDPAQSRLSTQERLTSSLAGFIKEHMCSSAAKGMFVLKRAMDTSVLLHRQVPSTFFSQVGTNWKQWRCPFGVPRLPSMDMQLSS